MSATVVLISYHGTAGATETDVTGGTLRFKTADDSTVDTNNPIPIPSSGTNRSYIKQLKLKCTGAPANNITNAVFYTDGTASATGWSGNVTIKAKTSASYTNPVSNGTTALGSTTDAFTYTSGSSLTLNAGTFTGTGAIGDYCQLQMEVVSSATPGTLGSETLTFQYDES
jgi:hypothetical protein